MIARFPAALLVLFLLGCGPAGPADEDPGAAGSPSGDTSASEPDQVRSEVVRGPVQVVLEVEPAKPRLSDELTLSLTVTAEERVEVELPPFGDSIGGFVVRSFQEALPSIENGRRRLSQTYQLEAMTTGEHVIRKVAVTFRDLREQGDQQEHTVETEPLTVTVSSFLEGREPSLDDLRPAEPPLPLEVERAFPRTLLLVFGGSAVLLIALIVLFRLRTRKVAVEPPLSPTERALIEFRELIEDDPLARGELQTFFVELTGIVRRYIERTTRVRAPEQTTEEFLRAMRAHSAFDADSRERLRSFLESADLVKFAAHQPDPADIEESFRRAQEFVGLETALEWKRGSAA